MIYIIIPVFNRINYTINCIESLYNQTADDFKIIVVDDGSTDNTSAVINEKFPDVTVLKGNGNLWWTGAMNLAVNYLLETVDDTDGFVLSLNNDLVVGTDYLEVLTNLATKYPKSLIGSVSVDIENKNDVHYTGIKWSAYNAKSQPNIKGKGDLKKLQSEHELLESSLLPGRGVLIPIKVYKEIGVYDASTFPHYMSDHDFSLRASKFGYKLYVATKAVVYSYVKETGLNSKKSRYPLLYLKTAFTSIKSPINITNRWRWAKKNAQSPAIAYFIVDMSRVFKSLLFKTLFNK